MSAEQRQFGIRGVMLWITAVAIWLWFLMQFPDGAFSAGRARFEAVVGILVVTAFPLMAGGLGHLIFTRLFHFRLCVVMASIVFFSVLLILMALFQQQYHVDLNDSIEFVWLVPMSAFEVLKYQPTLSADEQVPLIIVLVCFLPAHSIRPGLGTAIVTATGVWAWYLMGFYVLVSGG